MSVFVYNLILWDEIMQKDDFELFIPAIIATISGADSVKVNVEGCAELRFRYYFWVLYIHIEWIEICQIFGRFKLKKNIFKFNFVCRNFKTLTKR